ncbi:hypothetical protein L9F63_027350, partial [Diploptera punctata]
TFHIMAALFQLWKSYLTSLLTSQSQKKQQRSVFGQNVRNVQLPVPWKKQQHKNKLKRRFFKRAYIPKRLHRVTVFDKNMKYEDDGNKSINLYTCMKVGEKEALMGPDTIGPKVVDVYLAKNGKKDPGKNEATIQKSKK